MEINKLDRLFVAPVQLVPESLSAQDRAEQNQLVHAVRSLNRAEFFGQKNELTFTIEPKTRRTIMKVVDKETGEVIRQLPPEYVLRLAEDAKGS
jgi:flagellar protein FlaG